MGLMKQVVGLILLFLSFQSVAQQDHSLIGQPAPSFQLKAVNGKIYSIEQLKGKIVVLHFATTWCPFCTAEAPYLEELSKTYADKGVQVLIVDVKEDKALVEKLTQRFGFTFPVLLDEDGAVSTQYAPKEVHPDLPRHEVPIAGNLIIDKEGKIRFYSLLDSVNFDAKLSKLKQKLEELLKTGNP